MSNRAVLYLGTLCVLLVVGCESPDEKPAQEMLEKANVAKYRGDSTNALLTAFKVREKYPKTRAALAAKTLADEISETSRKEREESEGRRKRIAEKINQSKTTLSTLRATVDDMKQVAWYKDKVTKDPVLGTWIKLYFGIGEKDGLPVLMPLRLKAQFEGSDWVFARTLVVKASGKVYQLTPDDWKHENYGGTVWESCDVPLSMENAELFAALVGSDEAKIRFDGRDGHRDYIVPKSQLQAAKRVHAIWKAINDAGDQKM